MLSFFNNTNNIQPNISIVEKQEPRPLVCIHMSCNYCGFIGDGINLQFINYHFGIKHCKNISCYEKAKRDCADFMKMNDSLLMEKNLIEKFDLLNKKFEVIRSNGDIDNNWEIFLSEILDYAEFFKHNNEWNIKLIKFNENRDSAITKMVPISSIDFPNELTEKLFEYENYPNNEYIIYLNDSNNELLVR
jgi:hypothetical protein